MAGKEHEGERGMTYVLEPLEGLSFLVCPSPSVFRIGVPVQEDDFDGEGMPSLIIHCPVNLAELPTPDPSTRRAFRFPKERTLDGMDPGVVPCEGLGVVLGWEEARGSVDEGLSLQGLRVFPMRQFPQKQRVLRSPDESKDVLANLQLVLRPVAQNAVSVNGFR